MTHLSIKLPKSQKRNINTWAGRQLKVISISSLQALGSFMPAVNVIIKSASFTIPLNSALEAALKFSFANSSKAWPLGVHVFGHFWFLILKRPCPNLQRFAAKSTPLISILAFGITQVTYSIHRCSHRATESSILTSVVAVSSPFFNRSRSFRANNGWWPSRLGFCFV